MRINPAFRSRHEENQSIVVIVNFRAWAVKSQKLLLGRRYEHENFKILSFGIIIYIKKLTKLLEEHRDHNIVGYIEH